MNQFYFYVVLRSFARLWGVVFYKVRSRTKSTETTVPILSQYLHCNPNSILMNNSKNQHTFIFIFISIYKYLEFTFNKATMRMLHRCSDIRCPLSLVEAFVDHFTESNFGHCNKYSVSNLHATYNDLYCNILHISRRSK